MKRRTIKKFKPTALPVVTNFFMLLEGLELIGSKEYANAYSRMVDLATKNL